MHILNKKFDQIYLLYINNFEYHRAKHKLDEKGIKVNFFKGVNGYEEDGKYNVYLKTYSKFKDSNDHFLLNRGAFGHISSFINIISHAVKNNYNNILILEADIYFCKNFDIKCARYLEMDYKLLYFGASQSAYYNEDTWDIIDDKYSNQLKSGFYFANKTLGTFAIGINKSIYNELLRIFKEMKQPTDASLKEIQDKYRKECIVCYPNIICCDISKSNTTQVKNQISSLNRLRWVIEYEFNDIMVYHVERNNWYEFNFDINSMYNEFFININNNDRIINKRNINAYLTKDKYTTLFYTKDKNIIKIKLKDIFLSHSSIRKLNTRIINNKMKKISKKSLNYKYYASNISL